MTKTALVNQYRQMHSASERSEDVVLKLYDGAIGFLRDAGEELAKRDNVPEKARLIEKTNKIIEYLQSCLDMERGGEIAANLNRLYEYMLIRLTQANAENDGAKIKEVARLIGTLRDGWKEICKRGSCGETAVEGPATASNELPRAVQGITVRV